MVQLWVNLPARDKMAPPGYQGITAAQTPDAGAERRPWSADAGTVRPIAGERPDGAQGPAKTFTPMQVWDVQIRAGHTVTLPAPEGHTTVPLVLPGAGENGRTGPGSRRRGNDRLRARGRRRDS